MGGVAKAIGGIAKVAAPILPFIPGVGKIAAPLAGIAGNLLDPAQSGGGAPGGGEQPQQQQGGGNPYGMALQTLLPAILANANQRGDWRIAEQLMNDAVNRQVGLKNDAITSYNKNASGLSDPSQAHVSPTFVDPNQQQRAYAPHITQLAMAGYGQVPQLSYGQAVQSMYGPQQPQKPYAPPSPWQPQLVQHQTQPIARNLNEPAIPPGLLADPNFMNNFAGQPSNRSAGGGMTPEQQASISRPMPHTGYSDLYNEGRGMRRGQL